MITVETVLSIIRQKRYMHVVGSADLEHAEELLKDHTDVKFCDYEVCVSECKDDMRISRVRFFITKQHFIGWYLTVFTNEVKFHENNDGTFTTLTRPEFLRKLKTHAG